MVVVIAAVAGLGAGGWAVLAWVLPMVATTWSAARSTTPARVEADQPWNEYVLRATLVGTDTERPVPLRVLTGVVLGGPLGLFVAVYAVIEFFGSLGI